MSMTLPFFLVWLTTFAIVGNMYVMNKGKGIPSCDSIRRNDTFLAVDEDSTEPTSPWINQNHDNDKNIENGDLYYSTQRSSKNMMNEEGDSSSLLGNIAGSSEKATGAQEKYVYLSGEAADWDKVGVGESESEAIGNEDEEDEVIRKGVHQLPTHEEIRGGEEISIQEMPFLAYVLPTFCTSSIIAPNWVLTAAHCVTFLPKTYPYKVVAGTTSQFLVPVRGDRPQHRKVAKVFLHPKASRTFLIPTTPGTDVALLRLWKPFHLDNVHVSIISIRGQPWFRRIRKENCIIAGWGSEETSLTPNSIPNLRRATGMTAFHGYTACPCLSKLERERYVCMARNEEAPPPLRHACGGDSGGPLICDDEMVGVLHGRVLVPFRCVNKTISARDWQNCSHPDSMMLYTYTCPLLDWLRRHVGDRIPPKPDSCSANRLIQTFTAIIPVILIVVMQPLFTTF